jgi:hypothetical protein
MAALLKFVPISQATYGSDDRYFGLDQMRDLERPRLDASNLKAIDSGNLIRLIPHDCSLNQMQQTLVGLPAPRRQPVTCPATAP